MGLEYVVLLLLLLFFACGLALPVLGWAALGCLRRRRLMQGLLRLGAARVEDAGGETVDVPARFSVEVGGARVQIAALAEGDAPRWRLVLPVEEPPPYAFAVVHRRCPRPERLVGEMARLKPAPIPLGRGVEMRAQAGAELPAPSDLTRAMAALEGQRHRPLLWRVSAEGLLLEVRREGLEAASLLVWIERLLRVAEALGLKAAAPPPVFEVLPGPARIAGALSGNPVGLPG